MRNQRDAIFKSEHSGKKPFSFNESVARVFDNMAVRSIPLYNEIQRISAQLVISYYIENSRIYDLGCSTGKSLHFLNREIRDKKIKMRINWIGVDKSEHMCKRAFVRSIRYQKNIDSTFINRDLLSVDLEQASVIISHFTLQFLNHEGKSLMMRKIFEGLQPGGLLILSDKTDSDSNNNGKIFENIYFRFKKKNHYSEDEIARKKASLDGILQPLKYLDELKLIRDTGFEDIETVVKWFQFTTFIAFKPQDHQ